MRQSLCELHKIVFLLNNFEREMLCHYSLTLDQGIIFCILDDHPHCATYIALEMSVHTSYVLQLLKKMEKMGLLKREIGNRDIKFALTVKARELWETINSGDLLIPTFHIED